MRSITSAAVYLKRIATAPIVGVATVDLVAYLVQCNATRPHQGRNMNGRTPYTVFQAGLPKPTRSR